MVKPLNCRAVSDNEAIVVVLTSQSFTGLFKPTQIKAPMYS